MINKGCPPYIYSMILRKGCPLYIYSIILSKGCPLYTYSMILDEDLRMSSLYLLYKDVLSILAP